MSKYTPQELHSQISMMGIRQRFIFYTQKNHNFRICLLKKITTFFSIPKKPLSPFLQPKIIPLFFFATQKTPVSFIDLKKPLWAKIPPPSPVIKICEWDSWGLLIMTLQVWAWKWTRGKCCLSFIPLTWSSSDWCMSPDRSDIRSCLYFVHVPLTHKNTQAATLVLKPYFHYRFLYHSMQPIDCFRYLFLKSLTMFSDFVLTAHWWIQENKPSKYCTKYCYRWTHIDRISTYSTYNLGSYSLWNPQKKLLGLELVLAWKWVNPFSPKHVIWCMAELSKNISVYSFLVKKLGEFCFLS